MHEARPPPLAHIAVQGELRDNQQLAAHLVAARGLKPVTVSNGREALAWLSTCSSLPRLIMLDLVMPEMDGYGLIQVLDHHAEWCAIPTLILTAKELTVRERTHLERTTTRVVAKQESRARDLMAELDHVLNRHRVTPGEC